jgi:hypothetical protein
MAKTARRAELAHPWSAFVTRAAIIVFTDFYRVRRGSCIAVAPWRTPHASHWPDSRGQPAFSHRGRRDGQQQGDVQVRLKGADGARGSVGGDSGEGGRSPAPTKRCTCVSPQDPGSGGSGIS